MTIIDEILEFNEKFVESGEFKKFETDKLPNRKIAILACMDTRLIELLPAAMNIKHGDFQIIKNAGAIITHPWGSVMRSLLIAIYELGVTDILVIGHTDCGTKKLSADQMLEKMVATGIEQGAIDGVRGAGIDVHKWLNGFDSVYDSVLNSVKIIRNHPFVPKSINVYPFVIDSHTGKLTRAV